MVEHCAFEVRAPELGTAEVRVPEDRTVEVRPAKIR